MAINNPYIPGDPFSYDLKWLVRKVKEYGIFIEGAPATIQALIDEVIKNMSLPTEYINAKYPGHGLTGVKGDGVENDTAAFKTIIDYCQTNNVPLYVPADVTIKLEDDVNMLNMHNVIMQGKITGDSNYTLKMIVSSMDTLPTTWDITNVEGMKLQIEGVKNGLVRIQNADYVKLFAEGGTDYYSIGYSTFILGTIDRLIIEGDAGGSVGGWINSNVFLGGRITSDITFADSRYNHSGNVFYGTLFEGGSSLHMECGRSNAFLDARGESVGGYYFSERAVGNIVVNAYTGGNPFVRLPGKNANDLNGGNLVYGRGADNLLTTELTLSRNNGTYDVASIVKGSDGLICRQSTDPVLETDYIDITSPVWIAFTSDVAAWRVKVSVFDENKQAITTQPSTSCIYGQTMTWTTDSYYLNSTVDEDAFGITKIIGAVDTGVKYVKVFIRAYANTNFDHLTATISVKLDCAPVGFKYSSDKIKGSARPTSGTWEAGDMVYSTDPNTLNYLGWICSTAGTPGSWRKAGELGS